MKIENYKDLKAYLVSYEYLYNELKDLEDSFLPRSPQMNGTRTTSPAQKTTIYAHMIDKKNQLLKEMSEIEDFIDMISYDPMARSVIRSKFLRFNTLDGIANTFHRSVTTIKKHYNRGMNELLKIASKQDQKKDADQS